MCIRDSCYDAMETSLRELLRRLHGSSKHVGHRYEAPRPESLAEVDARTELRDKLQRAVDAEQFELAAELRDKLRVME